MINKWTKISGEIKYENPWIKVDEHQVLNPKGKPGIYGIVDFKNIAVAVLPLDENNNTFIVGQWRYTLNRFEWEIPEGGCPVGTSVLETAIRELKEETGLTATEFIPVLEMQLSNSTTNEISYSFVAKGLKMEEAEPEETEDLYIKKISFEELYEMVMRNEIRDALSVATILKVKLLIDRKEL